MATNTGKYRAERTDNSKKRQESDEPRENSAESRLLRANENIQVDNLYGFYCVNDTKERIGYLLNMHATEIVEEDKRLISGCDYYFLEEDGTRFKISMPYHPYFFILCRKDTDQEVSTFISKKYNGLITKIELITKEDLDLPNHLIGLKQKYLKLSFANIVDVQRVKKDIMQAVKVNRVRENSQNYSDLLADAFDNKNGDDRNSNKKIIDHMDNIIDIREYDVPHHVRVSIDLKIFVGNWYSVKSRGTEQPPLIIRRADIIDTIDPIVLAYDIETTKLPLKFPDANIDQIMMISYMIDGQGYLITNREIIAADIDNFEYTPKPEFEGLFQVFNEANEKATLQKFFNHIVEIRPHIFVTYNGDFFDWPFVETRAAILGMNMKELIGFSRNRDGIYTSRPAIHMDCLSWVKRDSYLPVGSQGLKAVTKAKLRYNPVEVEPEDMCRLAVEEPVLLANYSVSDAVATYYLYNKYVHPFIFALCTIIPMEPDEVLRKGSGTLCESLLMVEAFAANIIFPNKQQSQLNKLTNDGHVLDSETYVGGHVEALESGIFRADIPCRFKIIPTAVDNLISGIVDTLKYAIEVEENISLDSVTNFDEITQEIKCKLINLKDQPLRLEKPVIYHLDVGAMYPNIILTNRLQPSAMVDETICAACDFNRPGAKCKRNMEWMWRGEYLAASLGEYQRIQQQLETEKFPPFYPGGPKRAFHQLSQQDKAAFEKKRLQEYCKKAYKKVKITRMEERTQTVCQKENSFYVDTVRAFRDRRYEYKALNKVAKQQVAAAVTKGDAAEIKLAKNREILYDSLQLAHKCILNSFYGYVMRRGSRWFSMEMGGIVCYTGSHIIMKAREIIEQIGRPLELDTDGIWCMLPGSFPDTILVQTTDVKKKKIVISYPNAVLNFMVKDEFTNSVYHDLVDKENGIYEIRNENSIFFEVDGPYLAMVLPAAKEEGKKLKKRYAVFNFDGSLAELKGFEVKRRGELQLIKIFQSSVFESFLKGKTLEECYRAVAKVADYWLDILYSKGASIPDSELFELISENKSMSKKLEDYGGQKSTSISTAKRLAEFLGDQMVKDAGLACKYIISKKPHGAPVTERAIPLAIFQSEPTITRHYLRKWLKDSSMQNFGIREILDWSYYIERLGNAIQKIITIPAAMQGIANPVPRVQHPDWLFKKLMEKNDTRKQRKITEMFSIDYKPKDEDNDDGKNNVSDNEIMDIEDGGLLGGVAETSSKRPIMSKRKRNITDDEKEDLMKSWREILGPPPPVGETDEEHKTWLEFHRKKWVYQLRQRGKKRQKRMKMVGESEEIIHNGIIRNINSSTIAGFFRKTQRKLLDYPWQILQIAETNEPGLFKLWALVEQELHQIRLVVPRIFYVNSRKERGEPGINDLWRKCSKILPRSRQVYHLYQYTVPEELYQLHSQSLMENVTQPENEGIYETQMPLIFRVLLNLGCVCNVDGKMSRSMADGGDTFHLNQLQMKVGMSENYLKKRNAIKYIFLYHHWSHNRQRSLYGLFLGPSKRCHIFILDSVKTNQMPNMNSLYTQEKNNMKTNLINDQIIPDEMHFEVRIETNVQIINRQLQAALKSYKNEMKGATMLVIQSSMEMATLQSEMPSINDFPLINTHVQDIDNLFSTLDWQKVGARTMLRHYFKCEQILDLMIDQCRFFAAPLGNIPADPTLFGADLFYARNLQKHNFVLWCSTTERPDLGGSEHDDNRLLTDFEESTSCTANKSGTFSSVCVELEIESLAINTLLQSNRVNDIDGTSSFVAFHVAPQASLQEMISGDTPNKFIPSYDETAVCGAAFKVLRNMINGWLRAVTLQKNVFADYQIIHFYRWLRSPNALLYDPALRRTLHNYMKKLFIQLIAEFKKLGSIVVFANFNKIIICTKKRTTTDALGYIEFVVQTIKNKELFHSIDISYENCWEYLVWLDLANFAGIKGKLVDNIDDIDADNDNDDDDDDDDDTPEIIMNWNLSEILPQESSCRATFNAIIAGYITAIFDFMNKVEPANGGMTPRIRKRCNSSALSQTMSAQLGLGSLENTSVFAKKLISNEMSQKLFQIVQRIHKKIPEKCLTIEQNPNLNLEGGDTKKINPALELIKSICHVLSLDKEVEDEVNELQRNLLRLIGIGEFSNKAQWSDPCISFVLTEIICKACNHTRDIDLCKDIHQTIEAGIYVWNCPLCKTNYDNSEIEFALIDTFNRKYMGFILQDLQCKKCHEIQRENITEYCSCSGQFNTTIDKNDMIKCAKILRSIAKKCHMIVLNDVIDNTHLFSN